MKIQQALLGEHGVLYAMFAHTLSALEKSADITRVQTTAAMLFDALISHAKLEEELLFAALHDAMPPQMAKSGPLAVMRHEHNDIEHNLKLATKTDQLAQAVRHITDAIDTAYDHFAKEEQVLFPMADQFLDEATLADLAVKWANARRVSQI